MSGVLANVCALERAKNLRGLEVNKFDGPFL
jgi:hypothetical protein